MSITNTSIQSSIILKEFGMMSDSSRLSFVSLVSRLITTAPIENDLSKSSIYE